MKRSFFVAIAVTMSLCSSVGAQKADEAMPKSIFTIDPGHPHFLQADRVIDSSGRVRRDADLSSLAERNLSDFLKLPRENGRIDVGEVYLDYVNAPVRRGLPGAIETADFIIEGKVVRRSFGFMEGVPGQLLRLATVETLKGTARDRSHFYYVFVPVADFTIGGLHFHKTDRRYGDAPEVGDTLIVFASDAFVTNDYINVIDQRGYVRELPNGRVMLPKALGGDTSTPLNGDDVRRMIRGGGRTQPEAQ